MKTTSLPATERFINDCHQETLRNNYANFVQNTRSRLDTSGMAILENFIHPDFLAELRGIVEKLTPLCYQGDKRKYLSDELKGTAFWEVTFSDFMIQLVNDILGEFNVHLEASDIHPVLNILVGEKGQDSVKGWHFDATYLTIAMPIVMPPPGERDGKFRYWPNVRPFSQNAWSNKLYWKYANSGLLERFQKSCAVNFIPGNLYLFYGFRSYHGTDVLDSTQLRANCLMNYGGPFFDKDKGRVIRRYSK
jgi:hypothetical protein